ncbi:MAG TPA: S-layer homology domain-containing protein, partial [Chloroflexia bacterium]|nr:S-layer homology domain-containing protein [Chloroflexia bacterium]
VEPGSTFYPFVRCLACRDMLSGYPDGTFRPGNPVTRGQLSKIVSNAAGFSEPVSGQTFEDVAVGSTFYEYVERLASREIIAGYACGGPGEPCGAGNLPYFRPFAGVTRGQTTKIVAIARALPDPSPGQQTFADVPEGSTFWTWIEALSSAGAIAGYPCSGAGEPCDSESRPYFRPGNGVTRGQSAKIVSVAFFPECSTP